MDEEEYLNDDLEQIIEDFESKEEDAENKKENEAEEVVERRVIKPKRKQVLHPRPKLDVYRLQGPRGIGILESVFKDVKFKGKGQEVKDLQAILSTLEHWAHRMYPKMTFADCLDRLEELGSKKPVGVYVTKLRLGMEDNNIDDSVVLNKEDEFDSLISNNVLSPNPSVLTDEQRARMNQNRLIAEERRMARLRVQQSEASSSLQENETIVQNT